MHSCPLKRRLSKLLPDLGRVRRVVVMCTANRVRSPFAGLYLARRLPESVEVLSRGVIDGGAKCPWEAIEAGAMHGLDLSRHEARLVAASELLQADLVLTMELRMAHELAVLYPSLERVIAPLGYFDEARPLFDIADPYTLPAPEYLRTYDTIARSCDGLLHRMSDARSLVGTAG
jgi:protein-tyrosine phosphatase